MLGGLPAAKDFREQYVMKVMGEKCAMLREFPTLLLN
jgi:hypothetical protein